MDDVFILVIYCMKPFPHTRLLKRHNKNIQRFRRISENPFGISFQQFKGFNF